MLQILTIGFTAVNTMRTVVYIDDVNERKVNALVPQACQNVYENYVKDLKLPGRKMTDNEQKEAMGLAIDYVNKRTNILSYDTEYLKYKIEDRLLRIKTNQKN